MGDYTFKPAIGRLWSNVDPDLLDAPNVASHRIDLKVGDVVMCMRNLDTAGGLVNGTRMVVRKIHFRQRLIECETLRRVQTRLVLLHGGGALLHRALQCLHRLPFSAGRKGAVAFFCQDLLQKGQQVRD